MKTEAGWWRQPVLLLSASSPLPALTAATCLPRCPSCPHSHHPSSSSFPLLRGQTEGLVATCWAGSRGLGHLLGHSSPTGPGAGARERSRGGAAEGKGAEGGGAELSLPIRRRIVPDTRRPCGVSVSGSFAGAVTHARGVGLRAGSGQE